MVDIELVKDFVVDSLDLLDSVEPKLIELQRACEMTGSVEPASVNSVFRLFHSLKGTAGFLDFSNMVSLTHAAETLLDLYRTGKALPTRESTSTLFRALDLNRNMLHHISEQHNDQEFESAVKDLVAVLQAEIDRNSQNCPAAVKAKQPGTTATPKPSGEISVQVEGAPQEPILDQIEIPITPEMVDSFVKESEDLIDQFEKALLKTADGMNPEPIPDAFRAIHSFKGNCGFMALSDLGRLSHKMESVLELIKNGEIPPSGKVISPLLSWVDVLREGVADVAKGGKGVITNCDLLIELVNDALDQGKAVSATAPETTPAPVVAASQVPPAPIEQTKTEPSKALAGDAKPKTNQQRNLAPAKAEPAKPLVRQDIRVDLNKLDSLINLVGELVIAEAMVTRHPAIRRVEDEGVDRAIHQLRRVSRDLQAVAMSVRMIPLSATFQKMVRLVHDLSAKSGKLVELNLLGEETEVDKTVIEQIADPLVHIVRNAIDHGLETPQERGAQGKAEQGSLTIEGRNEGGEVWIVIKDDGRGLNREKILKKALDKGLISGDGKDLTDNEVYKIIFEPGFSTADKVTDLSGRGVGMDVVKRNIEKLKGRVDISSSVGRGATFILRIPLTLAIIDGMLVRVGEDCYTIPILSIRESLRPRPEQVTITPDGKEIVRVRDEFLPVIRLHQVFKKKGEFAELNQGILVVMENEGHAIALFVDEILGQQETVIKGLSGCVSKAHGISGCTILGDGRVSLILDVGALMGKVTAGTFAEANVGTMN